MERVYEINRNFRNEGISTQHNPEFTMLEFYEAYVDYEHLMQMTETMLTEIVGSVAGGLERPFGDHMISFAAPYRRLRSCERRRARDRPGGPGLARRRQDRDEHLRDALAG